jgi:hypothetical protein
MLSNVVGRGGEGGRNSIFFLFSVVSIYRINLFSKMKNINKLYDPVVLNF